MRWVMVGVILGGLGYGVALAAQSLPRTLINGRTSLGVNTPLQVLADGTVVLQ